MDDMDNMDNTDNTTTNDNNAEFTPPALPGAESGAVFYTPPEFAEIAKEVQEAQAAQAAQTAQRVKDEEWHMSKAEAIGILARMAMRRQTTLEEVEAIQLALRSLVKRMCDGQKWRKRKAERRAAEEAAGISEGL